MRGDTDQSFWASLNQKKKDKHQFRFIQKLSIEATAVQLPNNYISLLTSSNLYKQQNTK